jgi:branched-chain amino acid transport system substrate-binding protein
MLPHCDPSAASEATASAPSPTRRRLLVNAVALAAAAASGRVMAAAPSSAAPSSVAANNVDVIRLGQSLALTGPLGELGKVIHHGSRVCFDAVNAQGGVHGRRIELIGKDDGYDATRAVANAKAFLADPDMFALFSPLGTPVVEALLPLIRNTDVPCFAPLTGGLVARPTDMRNVMKSGQAIPRRPSAWSNTCRRSASAGSRLLTRTTPSARRC